MLYRLSHIIYTHVCSIHIHIIYIYLYLYLYIPIYLPICLPISLSLYTYIYTYIYIIYILYIYIYYIYNIYIYIISYLHQASRIPWRFPSALAPRHMPPSSPVPSGSSSARSMPRKWATRSVM